ncbi:MAG: hypothetical protein QM820_53300 [Minicystis sp.]
MPPVDDAHARFAVDQRRLADEHVALAAAALAQAEVAEVRAARIDRLDDVLGAARGDAGEPLHLLHQRGRVFEARLGDLIAQREELLFVVHRRGRTRGLHRGEVLAHACEELFLLGDDAVGRVFGGAFARVSFGRDHGLSDSRAPGGLRRTGR